MDFGVVLQTTPPSARVVDLAKRAETYGFTHVWTFDCHILWQEPYVIYSQILAETRNVIVGPMVTNPATRDWTVTAQHSTPRSTRCTATARCAASAAATRRCASPTASPPRSPRSGRVDPRDPRTRQRARRRVQGLDDPLPVGRRRAASRCGSPATARRRSRSPVRWATASSCSSPTCRSPSGRSARSAPRPRRAGRDPDDVTICVAAPAYVSDGRHRPRARPVPLVRRHGRQPRRRHRRPLRRRRQRSGCRRRSPTTSRVARATTTTSTVRPATRTPRSCPTRSSTGSASARSGQRTDPTAGGTS